MNQVWAGIITVYTMDNKIKVGSTIIKLIAKQSKTEIIYIHSFSICDAKVNTIITQIMHHSRATRENNKIYKRKLRLKWTII